MNTANNQLHRETEQKLREALEFYLEQNREPTVGQLCDRAKINRSTFYRHYHDVFDLMESVEREIQKGLFRSADRSGLFRAGRPSAEVLEPLIAYIGQHRHFYRAYLQRSGGFPAEEGFLELWNTHIKPMFASHGVESEAHMRYYFEYVKSGFVTILRLWLEDSCAESPAEIAEIMSRMLPQK